MNQLQTSSGERALLNSLAVSNRRTFLLFALLVIGMALWLINPGTTVLGQSDCGLKCQQNLYQCIHGGGTGCESTFDNCIESCMGL